MKIRRFQVDLFYPKGCPAYYYTTWVVAADPYDIKLRPESIQAGVRIEKITPARAKGQQAFGSKEALKDGLMDLVVFDTGVPKINVSVVNQSGDEWAVRVSDGTGNFTTFPGDSRSCAEMSARFVADLIKKAAGKKAGR